MLYTFYLKLEIYEEKVRKNAGGFFSGSLRCNFKKTLLYILFIQTLEHVGTIEKRFLKKFFENTKMTNPIFVFDITIPYDSVTKDNLEHWCKKTAKKWCFQREKSLKTEYDHWQVRVSLNNKMRIKQMINECQAQEFVGCHVSPTQEEVANSKALFYKYVTKEDTRVEGPWADNLKPKYMTKKVKTMMENGLFPWQQYLLDCDPDDEAINVIVDPEMGGMGKTSMVDWVAYWDLGLIVPGIWDTATKIMGYVYQCSGRIAGRTYLVDLPRAEDSIAKQKELYCALEEIKNGHVYDWRQGNVGFEQIPPPNLWVFANSKPNPKLLSPRKWKLWTVDKVTKELKKFE